MQYIVPDLRSEVDPHFAGLDLVAFRVALFQFHLVQFRPQHLHSPFAVRVLGTLDLAYDHYARRLMRQLYLGLNFVDVLSASTT